MLVRALLLPLGLLLLWALVTAKRAPLGLDGLSKRGTLLAAFVAHQAILVALTETLSIGHNLTSSTLTLAWVAVDLALGGMLLAVVDRSASRVRSPSTALRSAAAYCGNQPREITSVVAVIGAMIAVLLGIGWFYPPGTSDSLVYHLARVAHWRQDKSVAHFATHYTAQIELAPLHEFNMLHLHLLAGTDRLDGYPQLLAFVVCVVGASEIARLLGASTTVQAAAALICAVIPSAILEATSTQNNLFAAAIGTSLFVLVLTWPPTRSRVGLTVLLGLGTGLAVLAKGVLLPLVGPALALLTIRLIVIEIQRSGWLATLRRIAMVGVVGGVCAVVVAGPFLKRNRDVFDAFTGPVTESTIDQDFSVRGGTANLLRSVAVNFRIGNGESGIDTVVGKAALNTLRAVHSVLDVPQDDPRFFLGLDFDAFRIDDYSLWVRVEETGANPWHVILILATTGVLSALALRGRRSARVPALIALGLAIGFVAFSATAKWSAFVTRYQIPSLVIWAPLIAIAFAALHRNALRALAVFLLLACMPQLLDNSARSVVHPRDAYHSDLDPYFMGPSGSDYLAVRDAIVRSGCDRVGIANWILLEYPIWAGLEHAGWDGQIEHVDVQNPSNVLERHDYQPCALLADAATGLSPGEHWSTTTYGRLILALP